MRFAAGMIAFTLAIFLIHLEGYRQGWNEGYRLGQDSVRDKLIADSERGSSDASAASVLRGALGACEHCGAETLMMVPVNRLSKLTFCSKCSGLRLHRVKKWHEG